MAASSPSTRVGRTTGGSRSPGSGSFGVRRLSPTRGRPVGEGGISPVAVGAARGGDREEGESAGTARSRWTAPDVDHESRLFIESDRAVVWRLMEKLNTTRAVRMRSAGLRSVLGWCGSSAFRPAVWRTDDVAWSAPRPIRLRAVRGGPHDTWPLVGRGSQSRDPPGCGRTPARCGVQPRVRKVSSRWCRTTTRSGRRSAPTCPGGGQVWPPPDRCGSRRA